MENFEKYVEGRSLDELLKEAKECEEGEKRQIVRIEDNNHLLLRIKDKRGEAVFERFYHELDRDESAFSSSFCYLLKSYGCMEAEISLLNKVGKAYYSMRDFDIFTSVFNSLTECESSWDNLLLNWNIVNLLADYSSLALQFHDVFNTYEHFLPRLLPLKIGMKVRTVEDDLTKKRCGYREPNSVPNGSIGEVKTVNNSEEKELGILFLQPKIEGTCRRLELEILEPDPRNIDALAFRVLRKNIEEKFERVGK